MPVASTGAKDSPGLGGVANLAIGVELVVEVSFCTAASTLQRGPVLPGVVATGCGRGELRPPHRPLYPLGGLPRPNMGVDRDPWWS